MVEPKKILGPETEHRKSGVLSMRSRVEKVKEEKKLVNSSRVTGLEGFLEGSV